MSVVGNGTWREVALREIERVHKAMLETKGGPPATVTADELRKELRKHSGSFSGGTSWGGKVWPKACREYLAAHYGQVAAVKQKRVEDSPLFNTSDHHFPYRDS